MKALSLFSGMDGFSYAATLLGIEVVGHLEINKKFDEHYTRHWPKAQRFYDVKETDPATLPDADIIYGGEPCQGNSTAGFRKGKKDDRYLWPQYFQIVKAKRPRWVINENVTGSVSNLVLDTKITQLERIGYTTQAYNIPACAIGAFNERKRIWLVAYRSGKRHSAFNKQPDRNYSEIAVKEILQETQQGAGIVWERNFARGVSGRIFPMPDSRVLSLAYDVPTELSHIESYGNAVNPWIPYVILSCILQIENLINAKQ